jgi:hypothetical protein
MKNLIQHLKTSGITTTSGMLAYNGSQYIASSVQDSIWKTVGIFIVTLGFGLVSKLILDKVAVKKDK